MPMYGKNDKYGGGYVPDTWYKLVYNHTIGSLEYPHKPPTERLLSPKNGNVYTITIMTNIIHQIYSMSLCGL